MLKPTQKFAEDLLDALYLGNDDGGNGTAIHEVSDVEWKHQQRELTLAVVAWLDNWARDPWNDSRRACGDPVWNAVNMVADHLRGTAELLRELDEKND